MSTTSAPALDEYTWEVQPEAARWVAKILAELASRNPTIDRLSQVLRDQTGTRLVDWVDHLALASADHPELDRELLEVGYTADSASETEVWRHPRGMFPPVLVDSGREGVAIRCDSLDDCLGALPQALGTTVAKDAILGVPGGQFRKAAIDSKNGVTLWAIERHGYPDFVSTDASPEQVAAAKRHLDAYRGRNRDSFACNGFEEARKLITAATNDLGRDWACDLFFQAERDYWQSRNRAARVQYDRQNKLGLGWANHDHHTYRSSRAAFKHLIGTLELMGFHCRERFYAGSEAGWGAQVLEQPECRFVIFADVDMSPEELMGDFSHDGLAARHELKLGTVGLWCELHGEAFLEAGMHHLESQFDFDVSRAQLAEAGIETLAPFTDFTFLRQAFTRGETWKVDPRRIERLLSAGHITTEQAEKFRKDGAVGSHLEILERNDGYKGFNQTGVSEIILRTDPRRMAGA